VAEVVAEVTTQLLDLAVVLVEAEVGVILAEVVQVELELLTRVTRAELVMAVTLIFLVAEVAVLVRLVVTE
jgi:hypothetical protein